MTPRLIIGSALVGLVAALFALDYCFATRAAVSTLVCVLGLAGWYELSAMSGVSSRERGGSWALSLMGFLGTAYFLGLGWWCAGDPAAGVGVGRDQGFYLALGVAGLFLGTFCAVIFCDADYAKALQPLLVSLAGPLLLGLLFSYTLRLYNLKGGTITGLVFFLGIKGNDIVAYFVGRAIGRVHFLKVSPRKTLEGCLGAVTFSALWFPLVSIVWPERFFPWPWAILVGILMSITSQIGDLSESLLKRAYQVKDSGALLPEFGGVLDMIDSALFSGFVFWCLLGM